MKCKKCRAEIEKGSKFCPKCGAKIKHTGRRIAAVILILAIIAGGVGVAGWKFGLFSFINTNEAASSEGFALLTDSFTDRKITDQASALAAVGDVADILGIEDVNAEFSECKMDTVSGNTYYRFYQEYEGIPVYGRSVVVVADEDGEGLSLSSNTANVSSIPVLKPSITQESIVASVTDYIISHFNCDGSTQILVEQGVSECLTIYLSNEGAKLAYAVEARFNSTSNVGYYEFVVDANNGTVLYCSPLLYEATGYMASDIKKENGFTVFQSEDGYYLWNFDSNLYVLNLKGQQSQEYLTDSRGRILYDENGNKYIIEHWGEGEFVLSENEIFGDTDNERNDNYETGAKLLVNADSVAKIFKELGFQNNTKVFCYYEDGYDGGNNALGGFLSNDIGVISMGTNTGVDSIDVIAHEFTHVVSRGIVRWAGNNETDSINEALSDIFGEIIESQIANQEIDWQMGHFRNIKSPGGDCISNYSQYNESLDCHDASTLISHAAYLMYTGIGGNLAVESLSTNDLAHLFYRTLYTLPSDCTFSQFRTLVENTADMMCRQGALTEKQRLCVSKAFSQVGVTPSQTVCYTVSGDLALLVYDVNGEPYSDYDVSVSLLTATHAGIPFSFKETSQTYAANERLHLGDGKTDQFAQITITDKGGAQDSITYNVKIRSSGKSELRIYTDFGEAADDGFSAYLEAAAKTTATGSWTEDSIMTATWSAPVVSGITSKILTLQDLVTVTSCVDIDGYKKDDSSNLRFSGLADVTIAWQDYSYDNYGEYIDEGVESEELEVIGFFDPYSVTRDMVSSSVCLGNVIKFTVRGDAMTQAGIFTADPLWFCKTDGVEIDGDVYVTAEISMGKIDTLSMSFHMVMVNFNSSGLDAEADCVIEYRFFESETPSTDSADIIFDRIVEVNESNDALYEYATITSVDADGKTQWSYKTAEYECTELQRVEEIGLANGLYYFNASGTITALDPDDGRIVWENNDFGGVSIAFDWSDNGDLFLCGYYGPDFFWVDSSGTTKQRIETVDENYYWPSNIEYSGNQVAITMSGTPSGYGEHVLIVNLDALNGNPIVSSYQAVLQQHPKSTLHGYTSVETEYTLYDIDKDGILELIVKEDYAKYYIYTFDGISATQCGMFYWSYNDCLYEYDGNGMIVHNGGIGYLHIEYLALCVLTNGTLEENIMIESPDYDEIYSQIEAYTPINNFYPIDDDTYLLENS